MPVGMCAQLPPKKMEQEMGSRPQTMRDYVDWLHANDLPEVLESHGFDRARQERLAALLHDM